MGIILKEAARNTDRDYGFEIDALDIRNINYVQDVIPKIYERMASERKRIANRFVSEGREREGLILGKMTKDLEQIEATRKRSVFAVKQTLKSCIRRGIRERREFYSFSRSLSLSTGFE